MCAAGKSTQLIASPQLSSQDDASQVKSLLTGDCVPCGVEHRGVLAADLHVIRPAPGAMQPCTNHTHTQTARQTDRQTDAQRRVKRGNDQQTQSIVAARAHAQQQLVVGRQVHTERSWLVRGPMHNTVQCK